MAIINKKIVIRVLDQKAYFINFLFNRIMVFFEFDPKALDNSGITAGITMPLTLKVILDNVLIAVNTETLDAPRDEPINRIGARLIKKLPQANIPEANDGLINILKSL